MIFRTIKSEGLAHFSYLIGDEYSGDCAVIDPRRDVDVYLDLAQKSSLAITHVLETHIHADFVSGSEELSERTGAVLALSALGEYNFEYQSLQDGDRLEIGRFALQVLHTPGHTPEHLCFLISGGQGADHPWGLFTGDTLFAGEVGRPDLLGEGTEEKLAHQLFASLHDKILSLGDDIQLFPAHGKGSPCGASVGERSTSTIGYERRYNPVLQIHEEDEFVKKVLAALSAAPEYYPRMKKINSLGPKRLARLPDLKPLRVEEVRQRQQDPGTAILDTREIEAFGGAHISGAVNIALRKAFPIWAGRMLDPEKEVVLILQNEENAALVKSHLLRIGIDRLAGFLKKGMRNWLESGLPFERLQQMSVHELRQRLSRGDGLQVLDVRSDEEWRRGHIPTARHIFVPNLKSNMSELDLSRSVAVYCGSGYRASIAASLLRQNGFHEVYNVAGSMAAWKAADYELEDSR